MSSERRSGARFTQSPVSWRKQKGSQGEWPVTLLSGDYVWVITHGILERKMEITIMGLIRDSQDAPKATRSASC